LSEKPVATSTYSLYPKEARGLPIVGGYTNPNIEKIISHSPTLVVGQTFNQKTLNELKKFHIKTIMLKLKTIDDIKNSINLLANRLDSDKISSRIKAKQLIKNIDNAIKSVPKSKRAHSVIIVYGLHEELRNGIYIAGHDIFFDDIITACGNTNAYTSNITKQPVLGYENVIALNPDQIIILHSHATEPNVDVKKALYSWYSLPTNAAKNKHITIVDESYIHIPSHRVSLTIKRLCKEMKID
jgi:iron complex transport system substrate-binding protein